MQNEIEYKISCDQLQENNQNKEETEIPPPYVRDKTESKVRGEIFPNLDIVAFKPHK